MSGFTNIPNQLWDFLMDSTCLDRKTRIIAMIVRNTICWHKTEHEMSLSFISERLNIQRNHVSEELKKMIDLGLIQSRMEGQKRFLSIKEIPMDMLAVPEIGNTTVPENGNTTVPEIGNQKNNLIKITNKNNDHSDLFNAFWMKYPRKVSKPQAVRSFQTALKKTSFELIIEGLDGYVSHLQKERTETKYIKHPSTWLNAESWNDYKPAPPIQPEQSSILRIVQNQSSMEDSDRELIRKLYRDREAKKDINCDRTARKFI